MKFQFSDLDSNFFYPKYLEALFTKRYYYSVQKYFDFTENKIFLFY